MKHAQISVNNEGWVHLSCAYWIPEISFGNHEKREPVEGFARIDVKKLRQICIICKIKGGVCIPCGKSSCGLFFHPECGRLNGLHTESLVSKTQEVIYKMYCQRHTPFRLIRDLEIKSKRAVSEIETFCNIIKDADKKEVFLTKMPRKKRDKIFNKADRSILLARIKAVCDKLEGFSLLFEKPETEGNNYKLLPTFFETKYSETLRESFPWESIKFGRFTCTDCRKEYIKTIPGEETFNSKIIHKQKEKAYKIYIKDSMDIKHYCICHKQYHEDRSAMIGK